MEQILVIQHNVLKWTFSRRNELYNYYQKEDPDIILLNSTGVTNEQKIKIYNYTVYQRNYLAEEHAGVAIAIKDTIKHKIIESFNEDALAVEVDTNKGPVIIGTNYAPPRRGYFCENDIRFYTRTNKPGYLMADLNAKHRVLGHHDNERKGNYINTLINRDLLDYCGPDFTTLTNGRGKPDIVLANRQAHFNFLIEPGGLTTSDHIPIKMRIATKPIVAKIGDRLAEISKFHSGKN